MSAQYDAGLERERLAQCVARREGLIRAIDPTKVPSLAAVFPTFQYPDYPLLTSEDGADPKTSKPD